jgi:membrane-associated phospholipid phosphatase
MAPVLTRAAAVHSTRCRCGAVGHGDPPLVATLKDAFARVRPSTLHHTYSFPSGHTSAAVFIVGALVVVLLPLTVQLLQKKAASSSNNPSSSSLSQQSDGSDGNAVAAETRSNTWAGLDMWGALGVWGAAWVVTATGRVLADAHWVTDTWAGGMLAVAVVSALAQCCKLVASTSRGSSSSGGAAGL